MKKKMIDDKLWSEYLNQMSQFERRYAASEAQQRAMCEIIAGLPNNPVVVELGICYGTTSALFLLCHPTTDFYGVDNFSLESKYEDIKGKLDDLVSKAQHSQCTILNGKTQEVPWDKPIDFLFIDAGHDEANVKPDCEKWIPFVKSGGYVAFHDWDGSEDPAVSPHFAVTKYGNIWTRDWKEIAYIGDQLMIRQKP